MQRIYEYADGEVQDEYEKLLLKLKLQLNPQGIFLINTKNQLINFLKKGNFVLKFVQNNNNREGNQN